VLQRQTSSDGLVYYTSPLLARLNVPHAFTTRLGGVSAPPYDSLNLGNPSGIASDQHDSADHIAENYRRLHRAIGCERRQRSFVHQVHGASVLRVAPEAGFSNGACADAMITADASRLLAIRVADCVPLLVSSDDGAVVAAIHAGWRGVVAGIVGNAINAMNIAPGRLVAAIGPCIGFDSFEVGSEVMHEFTRALLDDAPLRKHAGDANKGFVDLRAAVRLQLRHAGLSDDRIDTTDRCTFRDADEFFSHRRDRGVTGRMAAMIGTRDLQPSHLQSPGRS
jgi:YfiH family protein